MTGWAIITVYTIVIFSIGWGLCYLSHMGEIEEGQKVLYNDKSNT